MEGPAAVDHLVVSSTHQCEVGEVGGSTIVVGDEVVGVGPVGWAGTVGDSTGAVAVLEGVALGSVGEAGGSAEVEDFGPVGDDASQGSVDEPGADPGWRDGSVAGDVGSDAGEVVGPFAAEGGFVDGSL